MRAWLTVKYAMALRLFSGGGCAGAGPAGRGLLLQGGSHLFAPLVALCAGAQHRVGKPPGVLASVHVAAELTQKA